MEEIRNAIKEARPSLSDSSLKVYMLNLNKLKKTIDEKGKGINFLKRREKVSEYLDNLKPATQQTYLIAIRNALLAMNKKDKLNDLIEYYYNKFLNVKKGLDEIRGKNEKTEKQEKNWSTMAELREVMDNYGKTIKNEGYAKKSELTKKEMDLLQKWVVANLYLHDANPPVRLDYTPMTVISESDFEKEDPDNKQNYLVVKSRNQKYFIFRDYKTKKSYDEKKIKVGSKLNTALNLWLKHNKSGSLLINKEGKPMTANHFSKFVNSVFAPTGKKIGASLIRHIYISERFPAQQTEKQEVADKMLHSVSEQGVYAKEE
jgi:hypothetical protein